MSPSASPVASRASTAAGSTRASSRAEEVDEVLGLVGQGGDAVELHRGAHPLHAVDVAEEAVDERPPRRRRVARPPAPAPPGRARQAGEVLAGLGDEEREVAGEVERHGAPGAAA